MPVFLSLYTVEIRMDYPNEKIKSEHCYGGAKCKKYDAVFYSSVAFRYKQLFINIYMHHHFHTLRCTRHAYAFTIKSKPVQCWWQLFHEGIMTHAQFICSNGTTLKLFVEKYFHWLPVDFDSLSLYNEFFSGLKIKYIRTSCWWWLLFFFGAMEFIPITQPLTGIYIGFSVESINQSNAIRPKIGMERKIRQSTGKKSQWQRKEKRNRTKCDFAINQSDTQCEWPAEWMHACCDVLLKYFQFWLIRLTSHRHNQRPQYRHNGFGFE